MYYCVKELGVTPSQYIDLSKEEKAIYWALMEVSIEDEKKQQAKAKRQSKRKGR